VGGSLILDTTFLVDLERERNRGAPGPATAWLEAHDAARLYLTFTVLGELAAALSLSHRARWDAYIAPFHVLASYNEVSWQFGRAYRHLEQTGQMIGINDLWIAATALAYDMPVVTRHVTQFRRVPGLEVEVY
jgi:predicted nucleic acid-binding protein